MAMKLSTPCVAIAGDLALETSELRRNGFENVVGILQSGGSAVAERDPEAAVAKAIEGLLRIRLEKKQGRRLRR
jgi:glycerate kinase